MTYRVSGTSLATTNSIRLLDFVSRDSGNCCTYCISQISTLFAHKRPTLFFYNHGLFFSTRFAWPIKTSILGNEMQRSFSDADALFAPVLVGVGTRGVFAFLIGAKKRGNSFKNPCILAAFARSMYTPTRLPEYGFPTSRPHLFPRTANREPRSIWRCHSRRMKKLTDQSSFVSSHPHDPDPLFPNDPVYTRPPLFHVTRTSFTASASRHPERS
jgi:hypothetical protein